MASYTLSSGETGYGIILNDGDQMEIRNGGFAENTGVNVGGKLTVLNGRTENRLRSLKEPYDAYVGS